MTEQTEKTEQTELPWQTMLDRWLPDDVLRPSDEFRQQYAMKYGVARQTQPQTIAEIGVRAGYSALAMLLAAPQARYVGIEMDAGAFGGEVGITARALPTVLSGFDWNIRYQDSRELKSFEFDESGSIVDLFHIDGDHSYDGAWSDLMLAWPVSRWILVDDYDFIRPVQAAVDHFAVVKRLRWPLIQVLSDGGFRGSALLIGARHEAFDDLRK